MTTTWRTARPLQAGLVLCLFVLTLALAGHTWVNSAAWSGTGPVNYPNQDCGQNWFWVFKAPNGNCAVQGGLSDRALDRQLAEAEAYDSSPSASLDLVRWVLRNLEAQWSSLTRP